MAKKNNFLVIMALNINKSTNIFKNKLIQFLQKDVCKLNPYKLKLFIGTLVEMLKKN